MKTAVALAFLATLVSQISVVLGVPEWYQCDGINYTGSKSKSSTLVKVSSSTQSPTSSTNTPTSTTTSSGTTATLPSSFRWSSSGALVSPKNDSRNIKGIKDPSIVYYGGKYHVFASTAVASGYNLVYFSFSDFSQANSATFYYLDQTPIGSGYRAAPQVFFFAPQNKWYLVYQNGNAAYSTNSDISNPSGWTAGKNFYSGTPSIITQNIGNGYWVDMWVICDSANCYLFSSDDNGHLYRSQTTLANFPNGMGNTVIALSAPNKNDLFEASNVYKVGNQYLLIVECIGSNGRYFRSWKSSSLTGSWTTLAATESTPFAGKNNVDFPGGRWTNDISHGEAIRDQVDQTMSLNGCGMRYLYQGLAPGSSGDYNSLPWRLGLLTQTNC
ncbi:probable alpha-L-arabinofuranosidase precursor [Serendipita indica DSM 11827]|uniref:Alpha-L-arabinofuranosidase n=1 Tax=Serendipita indica (strain DSM 11827) TaxID=1109443 RepID=G4THH9_SERID|nr:probable alpha-L-arabinofuranosidase precursor [Serendipita indica DSM 11827]